MKYFDSVHANRKLGWRIAMAGNGFALIASVIKLISSFILQWQTSKDHENITNAEKDWKMELEKRELLQVLTPHGAKLEKRTQMKYKKERIGTIFLIEIRYDGICDYTPNPPISTC